MTEQEKFEQYWCAKYGCSNDDYWFEDGIYGDPDMQAAWETWQAATAQAVPEGFVVVPFKATPKIIHAIGIVRDEIRHMSHNTRNELIYDSMIKAAQEDE